MLLYAAATRLMLLTKTVICLFLEKRHAQALNGLFRVTEIFISSFWYYFLGDFSSKNVDGKWCFVLIAFKFGYTYVPVDSKEMQTKNKKNFKKIFLFASSGIHFNLIARKIGTKRKLRQNCKYKFCVMVVPASLNLPVCGGLVPLLRTPHRGLRN